MGLGVGWVGLKVGWVGLGSRSFASGTRFSEVGFATGN